MTVGIVTHGLNAGLAALKALQTIEAVGSGAIGGFVSAVALHDDLSVRAETQSGGSALLAFNGKRASFEQAAMAGLMSSGPNRPTPLSAFLPACPGVGLVSGHRTPTAPDVSGAPMNQRVLALMAAGDSPQDAINTVLAANPAADAGFIAMNSTGDAFAGNTPVVSARGDVGIARLERRDASVIVLHNAITPTTSLANLAAEIALEVLSPRYARQCSILLQQGCAVCRGQQARVVVDDNNQVVRIIVPHLHEGAQDVLNLGYHPDVFCRQEKIGVLLYEPFLLASQGRLDSADGAPSLAVSVGCVA